MMDDNPKIIKDGQWFWPHMKCECGVIGCYDHTIKIACRECLTKHYVEQVLQRNSINITTLVQCVEHP